MSPWGVGHPAPPSRCTANLTGPILALPDWLLLGSAGAGPGGGPGGSEGASIPGAGGMSSALQETGGPAKGGALDGVASGLRQGIETAVGGHPMGWQKVRCVGGVLGL